MEPPRTSIRKPSQIPVVVVALACVAAVAIGVFRWREGKAEAPAPSAAPSLAAPAATQHDAPGTGADEGRAQTLASAISSNDLFRRLLALGSVIHRAAVVLDNLAEGVSPRHELEALAPERSFSVVKRSGVEVIAVRSYARYDAFANMVASVDPRTVATLYRQLHLMLESAYRALGYPGASLDVVTARALHRIIAAPLEQRDIVVRRNGPFFVFADARLENLSEVEKHLLRMGPRNTAIVQGKAREILRALDMPSEGAVAGHTR